MGGAVEWVGERVGKEKHKTRETKEQKKQICVQVQQRQQEQEEERLSVVSLCLLVNCSLKHLALAVLY